MESALVFAEQAADPVERALVRKPGPGNAPLREELAQLSNIHAPGRPCGRYGPDVAVDAVRRGLAGAPLISLGMPEQPSVRLLGSESKGPYATPAAFALAQDELRMMESPTKHNRGTLEWWTVEIVDAALRGRKIRRRRLLSRQQADQKLTPAAENLIGALDLLQGHDERSEPLRAVADACVPRCSWLDRAYGRHRQWLVTVAQREA